MVPRMQPVAPPTPDGAVRIDGDRHFIVLQRQMSPFAMRAAMHKYTAW
jgi:hypothetical protein